VADNTSNNQIARPAARWLAVGMTIVFAAAGSSQFISIGTRQANLWAFGLGAFPIAVWWEAATVRSMLGHGPANRVLMAWASLQMVLWMLAMYAADLADGSGCD
jgi:hypothetical protein